MPTQSEISLSPQSAKGDILTFDGSSRSRVPLGLDTKIITSVSSASSGLSWDTGVAGSATRELISTTSISTATGTVSFTSIPQTYSHLYLIFSNFSTVATSVHNLVVNGGFQSTLSTLTTIQQSTNALSASTSAGAIPGGTGHNPYANLMSITEMYFVNYSYSQYFKNIFFRFSSFGTSNAETNLANGHMQNQSTSAITSFSVSSSNASGIGVGSCFSLYGIKG